MGLSPIGPILVNTGTAHIRGSPVNVGTVLVHGSMQTGIQIPQTRNATMDAMS